MEIDIKSEEAIGSMRKAGKVLGDTLKYLKSIAKENMTTKDLDVEAEKFIKSYGMVPGFKGYNGYPATICSSVNDEVVHTIPNNRKLACGDILTIDCGVIYEGWNTDAAITFGIGAIDDEISSFIDVAKQAFLEGVKFVKPGNRIGDISHAIQKKVESAGFNIVRELTGHGIGRKLHEYPNVPNYGKPHSGHVLKPGMTIAIEPIITRGERFVKTLKDGWNIVTKDGSLAAQHEHTVLVTDRGHEILTN